MPSLPPPIGGALFYDGVWNDITQYLRQTEQIDIERGSTSEGGQPDPMNASVLLDNRDGRFSARNVSGALYHKIGRNTPARFTVDAGNPWLDIPDTNDGSRARTPDDASLDITGDIDIRVDCQLDNWDANEITEICNKQQITGDQRSWRFLKVASGAIEFVWTTDGTGATGIAVTSTALPRIPLSGRIALRVTLDVDNGSGGYTCRIYTAPRMNEDWELLHETITTSGTTSIFNSTSPLDVGDTDGILLGRPVGRFFAFQMYNGINGTLVADADFTSRTPGDTTWTDSVGRTWTLNASATISNTHVRMIGEVPAWPPRRNLTGSNKSSPIKPTGILRRLQSGQKPLNSATFRATALNPESSLQAYWPMEDEENADAIASGLDGGKPMRIIGSPDLHANSDFIASDSLPTLGTGRFSANLPSYTVNNESQIRFFLSIPPSGFGSDRIILDIAGTGSIKRWVMSYGTGGSLITRAYDDDGTEIGTPAYISFDIDGTPCRVALNLTQSGSTTSARMGVMKQADLAPTYSTEVFAGTTGRLTRLLFGTTADLQDTAIGHVTFNTEFEDLYDDIEQLRGYSGESAQDRIRRLCIEQGVGIQISNNNDFQIENGVQPIDEFVELLHEAADADQGYLLENRKELSLQYRSMDSMYNQFPVITAPFSTGIVSAPFEPTDDDKLTKNSVVVKVKKGSASAPAVLESGELSVQDPPNGVGLYDVAEEYSLKNISYAEWLSGWILHRGTFNGLRYTNITFDLANERTYLLVNDILDADVGDIIRLTDLPDDLPPDDVDLLIIGYTETMGPSEWKITFSCIPGEPFTVGRTPLPQDSAEFATNANNRADLTGATLLTAMDSDDTSMEVVLADNASVPWASAYPVISTNADLRTSGVNWSGQGGTVAYVDAPGHPPFDATKAMRFTSDTVATIQSIINASSAAGTVTPSLSYFGNGWIYCTGGTIRARMSVNWADASNAYLSTSSGSTIVIQPGVWTYLSASFIAPASASRAAVHFSLDDSTGAGSIPSGVLVYGAQMRIRRAGSSSFVQFSEDDFPLALRVDGEVVRADSCIPKFHETFFRTVASGWGTSDSGHVYGTGGGVATDYSVDATTLQGRHTMTTTNASRRTFVTAWATESDMTAFMGTSQLSTGASQTTGLTTRYTDSDNLYTARIEYTTAGFLVLSLRKRVAGVETELASKAMQIAHVANRNYGLRFYVRGSSLKAMCWDTTKGQALDMEWDLEVTDTDLTTGTLIGYRSILFSSNTNVNPIAFYSFSKNNYPQVFNVERSRNGAVKSIPVGVDVNVNEPLTTVVR